MSSIKIKDLPEKINDLEDDDLLVIEDNEDTKKITLVKLKSAFSIDNILTAVKDMLLEKINNFIKSHDSKHSELESQNKQLEVTCHNLENDRIHDADRIFALEHVVYDQADLIKTLQDENVRLSASLLVLQSEKENLSEQITDLDEQLNLKETEFDSLFSRYEDLQAKYKELHEENTKLNSLVESLETTSTTTIDNFFNEKSEEISTKIEELMTYIRFYHPDVDDMEG